MLKILANASKPVATEFSRTKHCVELSSLCKIQVSQLSNMFIFSETGNDRCQEFHGTGRVKFLRNSISFY